MVSYTISLIPSKFTQIIALVRGQSNGNLIIEASHDHFNFEVSYSLEAIAFYRLCFIHVR